MHDEIIISGASQHNLKNIDLKIPKNKLSCYNWTYQVLANLHLLSIRFMLKVKDDM